MEKKVPFTQLKELDEAVNKDDVEQIKIFCALPQEEAPGEADLTKAFINSVLSGRFLVMQYFCESAAVKSTAVTEGLIQFCKLEGLTYSEKIKVIVYLSTLTVDTKPQQSAIDEVLHLASQNNDWDFFRLLCQFPTDNAPSSEMLGKILYEQIKDENNFFENMKFLFENSTNKPNQNDVSAALRLICKSKVSLANSVYWNYIEYLCALEGANKPNQKAIEKAFLGAVNSKKLTLISKLCQLSKDNAPGLTVLSEKFIELVKFTNDLKSLKIIIAICESANKLTSKIVSDALTDSLKTNFPKNLMYTKFLASLNSEIKPDQKAIDAVIESLITIKEWDFIKTLCESKDNPPSSKALGKVLEQAGIGELGFTLMTSLFEQSVFKPSQADVSSTLITICKLKIKEYEESTHWPYIHYLLNLKEENKPSQEAIDTVFDLAYTVYKDELLIDLSTREGKENAASSEALETILFELVGGANTSGDLNLIKVFCEQSTNKPNISAAVTDILKHFSVKKDLAKYFLRLDGDIKPAQHHINQALSAAGDECDWEFVRTLCMNSANPPSEDVIENILERAWFDETVPFEIVKFLIEDSFTKPSQQAIDKIFANVCCYGKPSRKEFFDYIGKLASSEGIKAAYQLATELQNNGALERLRHLTNDEDTKVNIGFFKKGIAEANPISNAEVKQKLFHSNEDNSLIALETNQNKSCFSNEQIDAILTRISELREEVTSCFSFFYRERKNKKVTGLEELLRIGKEPEMTVAVAVERIEKDKRFPDLRAGMLSNRTGELLDNLLNANGKSVLTCK